MVESLFAQGYKHHLLMCRRNGLRRLISHLRSSQSGQYVLGSSSAVSQITPITIPLEGIVHGFGTRTLLGWLRNMNEVMKKCSIVWVLWGHRIPSFLGSSFHEDQIEDDPRMAYRDVCNFLDLPVVDVELRHRKMTPGRLADLIENLDEVRDCLSPSRFAWMLSE